MNKEDIRVYNEDLGLDGTIPELVDWANRYDEDYSDEALDEISRLAKEYGFEEKYVQIPLLVKKHRLRTDEHPETFPYEQMKIDKMLGFGISFSETKPYGEVEIWEERDKVLVSVHGHDEGGFFTAANAFTIEEFMAGEGNWLEVNFNETFAHRTYEDPEEQDESDSSAIAEEAEKPEEPETVTIMG